MSTHANRALVLVLTCLAQFMVVLDISIVNVALPAIQQEFDLSQATLQWIVVAYGLLLGGFLLLGGRMGDLLGRRRILLAGIALFSLASLVAGLATSGDVLIGARAAQGFGAALLAPTALSILAATFPEGKARNQALGIYGAVGGSSASVGVIASGLLTDGPGWRWIFFINVPVGIVLMALAVRYLQDDRGTGGTRHYDAAGATTVTAGLLLGIYGLNRAADHGWTTPSTLGFFVAAVALLAAFVVIERRARAPLVPGSILRNRMLLAANIASFLLYGAFFAFIFIGSLLMQQMLAYSPTRTGVAWLATSVLAFAAAAISGSRLIGAYGIRPILATGMALVALGALWMMRLPADAAYASDLLPAFLLGGIGIGLCGPAIGIGALSGAEESAMGLASGLMETVREVGGVLGVAAVTTVLVSRGSDVADPLAIETAMLDAFRASYAVIGGFAVLGMIASAVLVPRRRNVAPAYPSSTEIVPESAD